MNDTHDVHYMYKQKVHVESECIYIMKTLTNPVVSLIWNDLGVSTTKGIWNAILYISVSVRAHVHKAIRDQKQYQSL